VIREDRHFVAVPGSLYAFGQAWEYLKGLRKKWPWLSELFATEQDYQSSLCAYYMVLSIQELAYHLASGNPKHVMHDQIMLEIPAPWLSADTEVQQAAYRKLTHSPNDVCGIWRSIKVHDNLVASMWPHWIRHVTKWGLIAYPMRHLVEPVFATLFKDLQLGDQT
jgi:hypothetical protein